MDINLNNHTMKILKIKLFSLLIVLLTSLYAFPQEGNYNNTIWTVAWSPDGNYIATGGNIDALLIYDAKTFKMLKTFPVKDVQLSRLKWHPNKNILAVITKSNKFKAKLLHLDTGVWVELD